MTEEEIEEVPPCEHSWVNETKERITELRERRKALPESFFVRREKRGWGRELKEFKFYKCRLCGLVKVL